MIGSLLPVYVHFVPWAVVEQREGKATFGSASYSVVTDHYRWTEYTAYVHDVEHATYAKWALNLYAGGSAWAWAQGWEGSLGRWDPVWSLDYTPVVGRGAYLRCGARVSWLPAPDPTNWVAFSLSLDAGILAPLSRPRLPAYPYVDITFGWDLMRCDIPAPVEFGAIAGRVIDERTGTGLVADVSFPENPRLASLVTSSAGILTLERAPAGIILVEVNAEGYRSQTVPVNVPANATAQYEFKLRPLVTYYGVIAGKVTDAATGRPLEATIEFPDSDLEPVRSDPGTGAFRLDNVPPGIYTATASADGYYKDSLTVVVEEGAVSALSFALQDYQ